MEHIVLFVCMGLAVLLTGWLGYALARRGRAGVAVSLWMIPMAVGAALFVAAARGQGWDALGYFLAAMIFCAPPAVGLGIGTLIGWIMARRAS